MKQIVYQMTLELEYEWIMVDEIKLQLHDDGILVVLQIELLHEIFLSLLLFGGDKVFF
jgi:hypothetical protein